MVIKGIAIRSGTSKNSPTYIKKTKNKLYKKIFNNLNNNNI